MASDGSRLLLIASDGPSFADETGATNDLRVSYAAVDWSDPDGGAAGGAAEEGVPEEAAAGGAAAGGAAAGGAAEVGGAAAGGAAAAGGSPRPAGRVFSRHSRESVDSEAPEADAPSAAPAAAPAAASAATPDGDGAWQSAAYGGLVVETAGACWVLPEFQLKLQVRGPSIRLIASDCF